jgi:hypothetical protein
MTNGQVERANGMIL